MIGDTVVGTQGTPVEVLGRLIHHVFYPELWRVRNELTALSQAAEGVSLQDEAVGLLQQLLRLNTVNPPGNETIARGAAARLPRRRTASRCELVRAHAGAGEPRRPTQGRRRPVARASSRTPTRSSPIPTEWSRDPWSGDLADDHVWGRGALDMKNQVAASAVAIASLAREGFTPPGDLVFVAAADEEVGENYGLQWLCEAASRRRSGRLRDQRGRRRARRARRQRVFYLCAAAEKMSAPFRLAVHGRSGHASMPGIADNALVKAAPLIEKLAAYRPEAARSGPRCAGFLEAVLGEQPPPAEVLERPRARRPARGRDDRAAALVHALADDDRGLRAPERDPRHVRARTVDRRLLPGQTPGGRRADHPRQILGDGETTTWRRSSAVGGTRSPLDTPLWTAISGLGRRDGAGREAGAARAAPASPTRTGCARPSAPSRTASSRCGRWTIELASRLIHSADERTHVDDLGLGVEFLRAAARSLA